MQTKNIYPHYKVLVNLFNTQYRQLLHHNIPSGTVYFPTAMTKDPVNLIYPTKLHIFLCSLVWKGPGYSEGKMQFWAISLASFASSGFIISTHKIKICNAFLYFVYQFNRLFVSLESSFWVLCKIWILASIWCSVHVYKISHQ